MKFDTVLLFHNLDQIVDYTKAAEAIGFDGVWTAETQTNPFLPLALAAEHSERVTLGTAIATAFPRSPTVLAHTAYDLARYSNGRFVLGLGTQVRAHNELRLGVKWEKPVRKLRETIEAIQALWDTWEHGTPLRYKGEFFNLRLMTPFFAAPPLRLPRPPIYIAAVNELMLKLAGKACDGVHLHALHTVKYLQEYAIPHIEAGMAQTGRSADNFTYATAIFAIPTDDNRPASEHEQFVKQQISFYMSTPAYRIVQQLHGWENIAHALSKLARSGAWDEMPNLITDEILSEMAITGPWARLPHIVKERYGDLLDRTSFYLDFVPGQSDAGWQAAIAGFKQI